MGLRVQGEDEYQVDRDDLATAVAMKLHTAPFISSVYGVIDEESAGEQVGSGTFVDLRGETWLLTARHVLLKTYEAANGERKYIGLAASRGKDESPVVLYGGYSSGEKTDLGAVPIGAGPCSPTKQSLPIARFAGSSQGVEEARLFVHGFPHARSRGLAQSSMSESRAVLAGPADASGLRWFDPRVQFALNYEGARLVNEHGAYEDWVHPEGLSGSGVWAPNGSSQTPGWSPADATLVGVVTIWNDNCHVLVATRIEAVRDFLLPVLRQRYAHARWERRGKPNADDWADWFDAVGTIPTL